MIIHVGYPKSGSSFLQKNVFPNLTLNKYFDVDITRKLLKNLIQDDDIDYKRPTLEKGLYSSENLLTIGNPQVNKRTSIAKRLKEAGFNKVIILIRNQKTMIDSFYRQYIQDGGCVSFNFYLENFVILNVLHYNKTINLYRKIFSQENIKVIMVETLKDQKTFDELSDFIGEKIIINSQKRRNESLSNFSLSILIFLNHFLSSTHRPSILIPKKLTSWKIKQILLLIDKLLGFKKNNYINKCKKTDILNQFKDGNKELVAMTNLPLEKYNYPL